MQLPTSFGKLTPRSALLSLALAATLTLTLISTPRAAGDRVDLQSQLAQLQSEGASATAELFAKQASIIPRNASAQFMLGLALLEAGHADAAANALHRAWRTQPDLFAQPTDLRALYGQRFSEISDRLALQAKQNNRNALFLLGLLHWWGRDPAAGENSLRFYELLVGGDPLASELLGDSTLRADRRAQAFAQRAGHDEALAELLLASAQADHRWAREGKITALMLSTGKLSAARQRIEMHLDSTEALGSLVAALPRSNTAWWSGAGLVLLLEELPEEPISPERIIALAVTGQHERADAVIQTLLNDQQAMLRARLIRNHVAQLDQFAGLCRSNGPPPDTPKQSVAAAASNEEILSLIARGDDQALEQAAQSIMARKNQHGDSAEIYALTCAYYLRQQQLQNASNAGILWLRWLEAGQKLELPLVDAFPEGEAAELQRKLAALLKGDPNHTEARLLLTLMLTQAGDPKAHEHAALLVQMFPDEEAFPKLLALTHSDQSAESGNAGGDPSAEERKALGDAAMRAGQFERALNHYIAAGKLDAQAEGLELGLFAARFALKRFETAAADLAQVLEERDVTTKASALDFSTGLEELYPSRQKLKNDIAALGEHCKQHPLNDLDWLLLGVVQWEVNDLAAANTLGIAANLARPESAARTIAQAFKAAAED